MYTKGINNISLASIIGISLKTNKKCLAALLIRFRGRRRIKANNKYQLVNHCFFYGGGDVVVHIHKSNKLVPVDIR